MDFANAFLNRISAEISLKIGFMGGKNPKLDLKVGNKTITASFTIIVNSSAGNNDDEWVILLIGLNIYSISLHPMVVYNHLG